MCEVKTTNLEVFLFFLVKVSSRFPNLAKINIPVFGGINLLNCVQNTGRIFGKCALFRKSG